MSIREKEELLKQAARNWEQATEEHKLAGAHEKAAEVLVHAARNWEKAEEVHPIGYFNAMARRAMEERAKKLKYDPRGPRLGNN